MRSNVRISLLTLVAGALAAVAAPQTVQAASPGFGVEAWFAGACKAGFEGCNKVQNPSGEPKKAKEEEVKKAKEEGFTQAAGHQPFGVTDFTVKYTEPKAGEQLPNGVVRHVRVDVAPGASTNPQAVPKCSFEDFGNEYAPGSGAFPAPTCPSSSEIGENTVTVVLPTSKTTGLDVELKGKVYNLEQPHGLSSDFGVALEVPKGISELIFKGTALEKVSPIYFHTLIEGGIEYASDYHDFFDIKVAEALPLLKSRLVFKGNKGVGGFLTTGTSCTGIGPQTTSDVTLEDTEGQVETKSFESPIGGTGCELIPFNPTFSMEPETPTSDAADGITLRASLPHNPNPEELDSSDLRTAVVTLPPGMTMNPAAASGLEACTPEQIGIGTRNETACPPGSRLGTVSLEVPGLPAESLKGYMFLGKPASGPIVGPPYTVYFDAESSKYNIKVRLKTKVEPNLSTGQITATFADNPEQPFSEAILHFNGGLFAPVANPLECSEAIASTAFTPFSGTPTKTLMSGFLVEGCSSKTPAATQSTSIVPTLAAANANFTFNITRPEGAPYFSTLRTVLAPGVAGKIPTVPLCTEAQAKADEAENVGAGCTAASRVGFATATAGSGEPFPFQGTVYLTGPYQGAPYTLLTVTPVVAGPFNLGYEVTRSKLEVEPYSGRVIVTTNLPTIRAGVPIRLRSLTVTVDRPNYVINPTNCALLATESTVTSTLGTSALVSSPFQVEGCSSLAFSPSFRATTTGQTSKANGASLETTIDMPAGGANINSVMVQLPKQLPSRLTTLQKACLQATFEKNPFSCPAGSMVGGGRANTPLLPGKLTGPAFYVSHGGEAFPDLDVVMEANGVRIILVGKTDIKKGITTTTFATSPDDPVSSITVNLPTASNSALAANGNLCITNLVMPTTITAQNGKVFKQNTNIKVIECGVQIVGQKVVGDTAYLTVRTYSAGRISGSGSGFSTVARHLEGATKSASLKVPLSSSARGKSRPFTLKVRVGFYPKKKGAPTSVAFTNVTFP